TDAKFVGRITSLPSCESSVIRPLRCASASGRTSRARVPSSSLGTLAPRGGPRPPARSLAAEGALVLERQRAVRGRRLRDHASARGGALRAARLERLVRSLRAG